jgi:hypothetical protein
VGRNSLVHTCGRGSVHNVVGSSVFAHADSNKQKAMAQTLRIIISKMWVDVATVTGKGK